MIVYAAAVFGLIYGSFLNVVAWRLVHNRSFFAPRSQCPQCDAIIAWYDNIPVLSYLLLQGSCRHCHGRISLLYPFIELLTMVLIAMLWSRAESIASFSAYGVVLSACIVATRTDLEAMVIPQLCSLWLVPLGWFCAAQGFIAVSLYESVIGSILGFGCLWAVRAVFKIMTGKECLGLGDAELLAMIGAFFGPLGAWLALTIGSIIGSVVGAVYILYTAQDRSTPIPFGPFLITGALLVLFAPAYIDKMLSWLL